MRPTANAAFVFPYSDSESEYAARAAFSRLALKIH